MREQITRIIKLKLLLKFGAPFFLLCMVVMIGVVALLGVTGGGSEYEAAQQASSSSGNGKCVSQVVTKDDGSKETVEDPVPEEYRDLVKKAAETAGMPYEVAARQLQQESGFDPHATSGVGAQGIAQFMPGTWATYGSGGDPFNPNDAIPAYGRYMKDLHDQMQKYAGDDSDKLVQLMLAAYNAGPGNVAAAGGNVPQISETQNYVKTIMGGAQTKIAKNCSQVTGATAWDGDLGTGEWTLPCPSCVFVFGYQERHLSFDAVNGWFHWGTDMAPVGLGNNDGGPIIAPTDMDGVSVEDRDGCVLGYAADGGPRFGMMLCHMVNIQVHDGQKIKRGDVLGTMSGYVNYTPHASASHLHMEMWEPGYDINSYKAKWWVDRDNVIKSGKNGPFSPNIDPMTVLRAKGAAPAEG